MDKNELESQAEKYKREMMRLYGRSTTIPEANENSREANENSAQEAADRREEQNTTDEETPGDDYEGISQEISDVDKNAPDDTAWAPHSENDRLASDDTVEDYNNRYPEPDLSDLETDYGTISDEDTRPPGYSSEEGLGKSRGYIVVNVRTGDESGSVPDATVMVTAIVDGNRLILASGLTNQSGTTRRFELPVPDVEYSLSPDSEVRPYSLFDVSVTANGFFNSRSVDVPVFSGITSVQNFNMIPVPLFMEPSDETVTYFNQEPDFRNLTGQGG